MEKKKLIVLNTDNMDYSYGGVCPFIRNMDPYLQEAFSTSYIVLPDKWKRIPGSIRIYYLAYLWLHRKQLKEADFILSHSPEGSYVASFVGIPYAHVYHGNSNPMTISRFKWGKYFAKFYSHIFKRIDNTCAIAYTVGPARNEHQRKLNNPLKQDVKSLHVSERKGFIFAGRLESMKNVDRLIDIYTKLPELVRKENPFYIAGYGTQEKTLRSKAGENVVFLGKVDNQKMLELDREKKVLLMASSTEGMPTAIAEAFSVGVPVVSTSVGDIPTVVKDKINGRLLPLEYNDEEYIDCIMDVLNHYEAYARAAYETSRLFDREIITKKVISDINSIIDDKAK